MKFLHTADLHLGKKLYSFDRIQEQQQVLQEINEIANEQQVDAILIAGDLFDVINPSNEATELFYKELKNLTNNGSRPVFAIAGNHDSPEKIDAPNPLAKECGIILVGDPHTQPSTFNFPNGLKCTQTAPGFGEYWLPNYNYPLRILFTPFSNETRLKAYFKNNEISDLQEYLQQSWKATAQQFCDKKGVNIQIAHLFVWPTNQEAPEEPEGEKPVKIGNASIIPTTLFPSEIQYVALGHLHKSNTFHVNKTTIAYSGSPLSYSFSEAGQTKKVHIVRVDPNEEAAVQEITLQSGWPVLRATFNTVAEAVEWLNQNENALVELTLKTDSFLSSDETKQLYATKAKLLNLIPLPQKTNETTIQEIDLNQSVQQLFEQYFVKVNGQAPSEELKELFNEVLNENPQ